MRSTAEKRAAFRALHEGGCFLLPNPWDIGSAKLMQSLGFKAIASTSAGFAWTIGKRDNQIAVEDLLADLTAVSAAVNLPLNADFENGFATEPEGVAANVRRGLATGVCALSIEVFDIEAAQPIYGVDLAVERIAAAAAAVKADGGGALLVARTEGLVHGLSVSEAIDRLVRFAEAGADVLYAPGMSAREDIAALVRAVAPRPVNVLRLAQGLEFQELADLGVRRISIGGALARVAWAATIAAAEDLAAGSFESLAKGAPSARIQAAFG